MGCRKLDIRSQFYFVGAEEKSHSHEGTADYTQKTAYSRFSHTVISIYRYYSPELGRWMSRDPKYIRGTIAWFKFNRESKIREKLITVNAKLQCIQFITSKITFYLSIIDEAIEILKAEKQSFYYELNQEISGHHQNMNPYAFVKNNPLNKCDYLGLYLVIYREYSSQYMYHTWIEIHRGGKIVNAAGLYDTGMAIDKSETSTQSKNKVVRAVYPTTRQQEARIMRLARKQPIDHCATNGYCYIWPKMVKALLDSYGVKPTSAKPASLKYP